MISGIIPVLTRLDDFRAKATFRREGQATDVSIESESDIWDAAGRVYSTPKKSLMALVIGGQAVSFGIAELGSGKAMKHRAQRGVRAGPRPKSRAIVGDGPLACSRAFWVPATVRLAHTLLSLPGMPSINSSIPTIAWGPDALHQRLAKSHAARLAPRLDDHAWEAAMQEEVSCRRIERELVERERAAVVQQIRIVPSDPTGFAAWFEQLKETGPGQGDALFPWLAEQATLEDMHWFLRQEMAGEAGFDDLVALSQLKLPAQPKLEMARNYWDEMGQGHAGGMHGPMLERLGQCLPAQAAPAPVWEALALGNLMVALATSRSYAYQSLGALGVIELTAPGRADQVHAGLKRLHFNGPARRYYALHATLDVRHSHTWVREVLMPLVESDARVAPLLAEGALLRLRAGARCFERYRSELMPSDSGRWRRA